MIGILMGTGDAKHKVYVVFPYIVVNDNIIFELKPDGDIEVINLAIDLMK